MAFHQPLPPVIFLSSVTVLEIFLTSLLSSEAVSVDCYFPVDLITSLFVFPFIGFFLVFPDLSS